VFFFIAGLLDGISVLGVSPAPIVGYVGIIVIGLILIILSISRFFVLRLEKSDVSIRKTMVFCGIELRRVEAIGDRFRIDQNSRAITMCDMLDNVTSKRLVVESGDCEIVLIGDLEATLFGIDFDLIWSYLYSRA
jgi:hypothetical protein